jgi:ankyrin repeat protein
MSLNEELISSGGCRNPVILQHLIAQGADVKAKDGKGMTVLMYASMHGTFYPCLELLIAHGAEVNAKDNDGGTALMLAAINNHSGTVQWLIEHGAEVNDKDNNGKTALMLTRSENVAALLRSGGAKV